MFDKVNAGNERDVVRVEAEDGEALDDGLQLLHALPVDGALLSGISPDVEELSKGRQKFFRQAVERWSRLLRKMSGRGENLKSCSPLFLLSVCSSPRVPKWELPEHFTSDHWKCRKCKISYR